MFWQKVVDFFLVSSMSPALRIFLILASVFVTVYALRKIRKAQLDIDDSFFWIFFSGLLLLMSIFPHIPIFCATLLGIESPANFVFLFMLCIAFFKLFSLVVELSTQKRRLNLLIQRLALREEKKNAQEKETRNETDGAEK